MDNRSTFRYLPREFYRWSEQVASGAARWMARPSEQAGKQANPLPTRPRRDGEGACPPKPARPDCLEKLLGIEPETVPKPTQVEG